MARRRQRHRICLFCEKGFTDRSNLMIHLRTHTKEKPFSCSTCEMTFSNPTSLTIHQFSHSAEKQFKCDICSAAFHSPNQLWHHKKSHFPPKMFTCSKCDFSCKSVHALKNHNVAKHLTYSERQFSCSLCEKRFTVNATLQDHIRVHTGEKPFKCATCSLAFSSSTTLSRHKKIHEQHRVKVKCELCPQMFTYTSSLKDHIRRVHGENNKKHGCTFCHMKFFRRTNQLLHEKVHKKLYECPKCGNQLKSLTALNCHKRENHGKNERVKCPICSKGLSSSSLHHHLILHSEERPVFRCLFCPYQNHLVSSLRIHVRTHTGEKPFFCELCEKCFTTRGAMEDILSLRTYKGRTLQMWKRVREIIQR